MKKTCLLFLLFNFFFLLSPSLALDPVIITDTIHSYPNTSGQDQNYIPSDPNLVDTVSIEKTINISQSFSPQIESQVGDSAPIYTYQNINQIQEDLDSNEINTGFYRKNFYHFAQPLLDPLASPDAIKSTFTSYYSSHNTSRRSLSAASQRCFISQQISDISTFIAGGNSVCIDREIDTSKGKIRIGEIISALLRNNLGRLYYPDPNCPPNQEAQNFPSEVLSALQRQYPSSYRYSLTIGEYQQLYLYGIEPVCTNSLAQSVTHCDLDQNGRKSNCVSEIRSQPLAAATSNQQIYRNYLPKSTQNVSTDYSQTKINPPAVDRPNPISWLAQFFRDFFSGRLDQNLTFSGPQSVTTKVDTRQTTGLQAHETAIKNFIPSKDQNSDSPASGTNGVTLDPGDSNDQLERQFFRLTQPAAWRNRTLSPL